SSPSAPYWLLTGDREALYGSDLSRIVRLITRGLPEGVHRVAAGAYRLRHVALHRFSNYDGPYYSADPVPDSAGCFRAIHVYPQTATRRVDGYVDATRFFLNTLLAVKREAGYGRRERFPGATWTDVAVVLDRLAEERATLGTYDPRAAEHLDTV